MKLKIVTLIFLFWSGFLAHCSWFYKEDSQGSSDVFKARKGEIIVRAKEEENIGFFPSKILAHPGQKLKLKVVNDLSQNPISFYILKKGEDPIVTAYLGIQEGKENNFKPPQEYIMAGIESLNSKQSEKILLSLPFEEGDYFFISTYPHQVGSLSGRIEVRNNF